MLALRVDYLRGRCVATAYNDRVLPEWPPHPARVYSALVSAWGDAESPDPDEARALEWLAAAGAPSIHASPAARRQVVLHFVPVNDVTVLGSSRERAYAAEAEVRAAGLSLSRVDPSDRRAGRSANAALARAERKRDAARERFRAELRERVDPRAGAPKDALRKAVAVLPEGRIRQQRSFPSVAPEIPTVYLVWDSTPPEATRAALAALAARVASIGHSSSLVHCRLADPPGREPDWVPDASSSARGLRRVLRVPLPDQLGRLREAHSEHGGVEPRVLPCRFQPYRAAAGGGAVGHPGPVFTEEWIVFRRTGGPRYSITAVADIAAAVRGALLSHAEDPTLEALSGHDPEGRPSAAPHVAFVPLPFVGSEHATGDVVGVAVVLPEAIEEPSRTAVLRAIGRWEAAHRCEDEEAPVLPVHLGRIGVLEIERVAWGEARLATLRPRTWCAPSRRWISATPVALDRNPGDLLASDAVRSEAAHREAAASIAAACGNSGLPLPRSVTVIPSATMPGTVKARDYPPYPRARGRIRRVKVHASILFAEPVRGPVLLGAGRYYGLGLFRPLDRGGEAS